MLASQLKESSILSEIRKVVVAFSFLLSMAIVHAQGTLNLKLAWDAPTDTRVSGYKIRYGTASRSYQWTNVYGRVAEGAVSNLLQGTKYYFAISSVLTNGVEGLPASEMIYQVNCAPCLATIGGQTWSATGSCPVVTVPAGAAMSVALSGNDPDLPSQTLSYSIVSAPVGATLDAAGLFKWTPPASVSSSNTVTIRISDNGVPVLGDSKSFVIITTVPVVNRLPTATADKMTANAGKTTRLDTAFLLRNDTDPDGNTLQVVSVDARSAKLGYAVVSNGYLYYTPPSGYLGADSLNYQISDGHGGTATGAISITVKTTSKPQISPSTVSTQVEGVVVQFQGTPNVQFLVEASGDLVTWSGVGLVTSEPSGLVTYTDSEVTDAQQRFYRLTLP